MEVSSHHICSFAVLNAKLDNALIRKLVSEKKYATIRFIMRVECGVMILTYQR